MANSELANEYYNKLSERFSSSDLSLMSDYQLIELHAYVTGHWGHEVTALRSEFIFEDSSVKLINSATGRLLWSCPIEDRYRPELHDPSRYARKSPIAGETWAVQTRVRHAAARQGISEVDHEALGAIASQVKTEAEVEELYIEPDFEVIHSGSNPPLLYPAARISTVSGTIILNHAMMFRLREDHDGVIPEGVEVMLAEKGTRVGLRFHAKREPGNYTLGLATQYNRGYTIHCGQVIHYLVSSREAQLRGSHEHGSNPIYSDPAANYVYGRRRLNRTPSGVWTFSLSDPKV